jgi:hypothetical protein
LDALYIGCHSALKTLINNLTYARYCIDFMLSMRNNVAADWGYTETVKF